MNISLIALTGPEGQIGYSTGVRPEFFGPEAAFKWFLDTVGDGIVVCGRVTVSSMIRDGVDPSDLPYSLAIFTRKYGPPNPESFLDMLAKAFPGKDVFIAGGRQTYDAFLPFCTNFFIRKAQVKGSPDLYLPPIFSPKGFLH